MRLFRCAALAAALLSLLVAPARAQDVTLSSRDGSVEISGALIGFDGEFYRVDTIYGPLTLDGQGVICTGPGCPGIEAHVARFRLSGTPVLGEVLMPALIETYADQRGLSVTRDRDGPHMRFVLSDRAAGHPVAEIDLTLVSTEEGFADLLAETADIVMADREPRPDEIRRLREAGFGDLSDPARRRVVALDAIVPVVAPGHPVQALSIDAVIGLATGQIADWSALGGPEAPVTVHLLDRQDGLQQAIALRLLDGASPTPAARRHKGAAALSAAVAADPLGVGLTRVSALGDAQQVPLTGGCGLRLVANRQSVKTEDYPLVAPLFLYASARRQQLFAREFLDWLDTAPAQLVIRRAGFVDQLRDTIPFGRQGDRLGQAIAQAGPEVPLSELQRLVGTLAGAQRLTTTFRFREGGSAELDAQSFGNIGALARALEAGLFDGRTLIFAGFTDGDGPAEANLGIARLRAEAVHDAVRAVATAADLSRVALRVEAFGEALPIACDHSAWGGFINRRVEVWLR
ncbi:phosphate ABC transporter substrate-binding/OmpA family protein [Rhodovulum tesquicola]|uniref:phosphate ABC transporter substrate-binding/OmpA family protein n=1 Tax=Rhodovulum tesquicola TaxID=540254 RepID=UPI002097F880|nr:phosphate ABC transporter substrate-binding/OmpA family protein [Rhodovulum tesquicola]MCO8143698.1 phosphate ABC transporter substrate-binding/OmpA family protein [Rhodovulum tesquicola]